MTPSLTQNGPREQTRVMSPCRSYGYSPKTRCKASSGKSTTVPQCEDARRPGEHLEHVRLPDGLHWARFLGYCWWTRDKSDVRVVPDPVCAAMSNAIESGRIPRGVRFPSRSSSPP